jgi:type I restriction enzyme R subunit
MALIAEVQTDEFWTDVSPEDLETVRRALRGLVQLIEPIERKIVYTDFADEIGNATEVHIDAVSGGMDKARFTMKVRRFLEKNKDHIALLKLRRAEQLTQTDLDELEHMFLSEGVALTDGKQEIELAGGFGLFLRSLTGLDRKAAKQAFSVVTEGRNLTSAQTEFLDLVVNHLTERGVVEPEAFYESPYTDLNGNGIEGIFPSSDVMRIVTVVREIKLTAVA